MSSKVLHSRAGCILGLLYSQGQYIDQNLTKSVEYFKKSAEMGNSKAIFYLGACYENGGGVENWKLIR